VRDALGIGSGDITAADAAGFLYLQADDHGITSLEGIQCLTSLTSLLLSDNEISDLSPVAALFALQELVVDGDQISDLSPLASLTALDQLSMEDDQITDLGPLNGAPWLSECDYINLKGDPIDADEEAEDIAALDAAGACVFGDWGYSDMCEPCDWP